MGKSSTSYTTDREHPLVEKVSFRVDKPTKEALKAGELPGWTIIAREAVEKALAEKRAAEKKLKSA